jgi:hypothetical protein
MGASSRISTSPLSGASFLHGEMSHFDEILSSPVKMLLRAAKLEEMTE